MKENMNGFRLASMFLLACLAGIGLFYPCFASGGADFGIGEMIAASNSSHSQFAQRFGHRVHQGSQDATKFLELHLTPKQTQSIDRLLKVNGILSLQRFFGRLEKRVSQVSYSPKDHSVTLGIERKAKNPVRVTLYFNEKNQIVDFGYNSFRMNRNMAAKLAWSFKFRGVDQTIRQLETGLNQTYGSKAVQDCISVL